jgi:hypothetical protein
LLRISDDYDFLKMDLSSRPDEIILRIKLPDFDPSELRAIQTKEQETVFIKVDELIKLQKAGFRRPSDVPPKPQPKDRRTLRERARQKMFRGEPRAIRAIAGVNVHGVVTRDYRFAIRPAFGMPTNGSAKNGADANTASIGTSPNFQRKSS